MIIYKTYKYGTVNSATVPPYTVTIPNVICAAGDLIFVRFFLLGTFDVIGWPSGFTLVKSYHDNNIPVYTHYLFAKIAGSSEPTEYTFTLDRWVSSLTYHVVNFAGVNQNQPIFGIVEYIGTGGTASLSGVNLQQGSIVVAIAALTGSGYFNSSDNWPAIYTYPAGGIFYQIFGGASQTENPIVFNTGYTDNKWNFWLIELKDANPIIYDTIFVNWLLTDEPGSKLWVKINGEWKPAKITII